MSDSPKGLNEKKRVLLIDDDDYFRFALATELRAAGYIVVCAEDGERGIRMVEKNRDDNISYHMIITDLVMPRKDGLMFCNELKRIDERIPVLVITGNLTPELKSDLGELGCVDYLEKPFTPEELRTKVEVLISSEGGENNGKSGAAEGE